MVAIFLVSGIPNLGPLPANTSDKVAHFAAYALLGALLARAVAGAVLVGYTGATVWKAWMGATLYAASDELHQSFVPGRTASLADGLADSTGALVGAVAMLLIARWVLRSRAEARDRREV